MDNLAIKIAKKNTLKTLIRKVSNKYNGDDPIFLQEYIEEVLQKYSANLDVAIKCFESLL